MSTLKLPIDDQVPSGLGRPVLILCCPAVLQLQKYLGVCRSNQLDLKIQWLLQIFGYWVRNKTLEGVVRVIWRRIHITRLR